MINLIIQRNIIILSLFIYKYLIRLLSDNFHLKKLINFLKFIISLIYCYDYSLLLKLMKLKNNENEEFIEIIILLKEFL